MSWVTVIWAMIASACLMLALVHLLVWWRRPNARASLLFALMALATAFFAGCELWMMRATTPLEYGMAVRWAHVPAWLLIVSLVGFVRLYLRAGRLWLAWTVCGVRTLSLILNFVFIPNLNYQEITGLRPISFLGETIVVADGIPNPWMLVGQLSLLLLVIFVVDATITVWKRGDRRQALWVGGSIAFFTVAGTIQVILTLWGILHTPITTSLFFMAIVGAMGYELSLDMLRAAQLSDDLRDSQQRMALAVEARFRLVVEASPNGIVLVDAQGHILLMNASAGKLFGYEGDELIGQGIELLVPERFRSDHPAHRADFHTAPAAWAMGAGRELFARRKDGTEFPVEIGISPIQSPEGTLVLSVIVDISTRKQSEAEAVQHRNELNYLSRVAVIGEIAGSLAHELNQPLLAIVTNASAGLRFLEQDKLSGDNLRELLQDIVADGRRAADVIRTVKGMGIKEAGALQLLNLNQVITEFLRMTRSEALAHDCTVLTELHPALPNVEGNLVQLQQVFLNLILNAFEASNGVPIGQRRVIIRTEPDGDGGVRASVRDFGTGLPGDLPERVFDRFFTTKREGMGIGLFISRSIAVAHGGTLLARNVEDGGAEFSLRLPVSKEIQAKRRLD